MESYQASGQRLAIIATAVTVLLGTVKLLAGLLGNSYALVADAVESFADIFSSAVVWGGLRIASRARNERYPYGFGRAESIAALVVSAILATAAIGITIEAIQEIRIPHHAPEPFTLFVLLGVIAVKEVFFRVVRRLAESSKSTTIEADAWHHRADAITSFAAFVGISVALIKGPGWESADDYAALVAAVIIAYNAYSLAQAPLRDLLDTQHDVIGEQVRRAAEEVQDIKLVEKVFARRSGTKFFVDMHLWVDGDMSVREAHEVAHRVKDHVLEKVQDLEDVLIHVEPADQRPLETSAS